MKLQARWLAHGPNRSARRKTFPKWLPMGNPPEAPGVNRSAPRSREKRGVKIQPPCVEFAWLAGLLGAVSAFAGIKGKRAFGVKPKLSRPAAIPKPLGPPNRVRCPNFQKREGSKVPVSTIPLWLTATEPKSTTFLQSVPTASVCSRQDQHLRIPDSPRSMHGTGCPCPRPGSAARSGCRDIICGHHGELKRCSPKPRSAADPAHLCASPRARRRSRVTNRPLRCPHQLTPSQQSPIAQFFLPVTTPAALPGPRGGAGCWYGKLAPSGTRRARPAA